MSRDDDFNWLEDAFDDKKHAEEMRKAEQKKGAMNALTIAIVAVAVLFVFALLALAVLIPG